jgi:hypothetical protein
MAAPNKKPAGEIRASQLITSYGPGAMADLERKSVLIGGLRFWSAGRTTISEPRLAAKIAAALQVPQVRLETPPPADDTVGAPKTGISVFEFPQWFVTQDGESNGAVLTRALVPRAQMTGEYYIRDRKKFRAVPIRFVRACPRGHIGDIDWYFFAHEGKTDCNKVGRRLYLDETGTSGDIGDIRVRCDCGRSRALSGAVEFKKFTLGRCDGARPWLGPRMAEGCPEPNRLLVRTASNTYFPQKLSVISLPERDETVRDAVSAVWDFLEMAESASEVAKERRKPKVKAALEGISDDEVWKEIVARQGGGSGVEKTVKAAELETLINAKEEMGNDVPEGTFFARAVARGLWDKPWMAGIERVVLVHRLREVSSLIGFTRFEASTPNAEGEVDLHVRRAPLADPVDWVPTVENRGEGIFIQFREEAILEWRDREAVQERGRILLRGFERWKADHPGFKGAAHPIAYWLLHSFAHLLLTAIALECGYPASSIKERVYAIDGIGYGVLLYTASADAEGTLGGLVDTGRRIHKLVEQALELGRLCSNDPVCAQHRADSAEERRYLHGAACHGCQFIAETSCEAMNEYLDRALVVETVAGVGAEFFRDLG